MQLFFLSASWLMLAIVFSSSGQSIPLEELQKHFPDEKVAFDEFQTRYTYFLENGRLKVREENTLKLVALKSSANFVWPVFFNDIVKHQGFEVRNQTDRKVRYAKYCGHFSESGIFHSDAKLCTYEFDMPATGEYVMVTYTQVYDDPRYFTRIPIYEFVPGKDRVVEVWWPQWVDVELRPFHFQDNSISVSDLSKEDMMGKRYSADWVPNFSKDDNRPHLSQYVPHLVALTKSYHAPEAAQRVTVLENTAHLYAWYKELMSGMENRPDSLTNLVKELTQGVSNEEKVRQIFYWVQDNIKYIAFENGIMAFQPDGAHEVFYKRYGDCKGMANLMKEMLLLAGLDARLTWLGTNHLPYTYDLPSLTVDNHMICAVMMDGDWQLLDATAKYIPLGYQPYHIQGKQVMIEDGDNYIIKEIPRASFEQNFEQFQWNVSIDNNQLKGEGRMLLEGDAHQFLLMAINNINKDNHDIFLRNFVAQEANPDEFDVEVGALSRDSTAEIRITSAVKNRVTSFGDELYVQLDVRRELAGLKMSKDRRSPYDFGRRRKISNAITLDVPEGYVVKKMPASQLLHGDGYSFELIYTQDQGKIVYRKSLLIDTSILPVGQFEDWNKHIDVLTKFYKEPIIFTKHEE